MSSYENGGAEPNLCAGGCGFFGSPDNMNYCSVCYRKHYCTKDEKKNKPLDTMFFASKSESHTMPLEKMSSTSILDLPTKPIVDAVDVVVTVDTAEPALTSGSTTTSMLPPPPPAVKNRCDHCNKRLRILDGFKCKCGSTFCVAHRYSDQHECGYDFKSVGRDGIAAANPLVKKDKLKDRI